jgi:hypothetical protein
MNDQAASLRRLKQMVDQTGGESGGNPEKFLAEIVRPSPFSSVALIIPDMAEMELPPVASWISGVMQHSPRACFWDQAEVIAKSCIPQTHILSAV